MVKKNESGYEQKIDVYQCENCEGCPYRSLCTKSEYGRMVQRNENWLSHKKKVNEILHTEKYHELMKQRSSNAKQFLDRQNKKIPQDLKFQDSPFIPYYKA